jgi:hypothetical protein
MTTTVTFDGEHVLVSAYGIAFAYSPEDALSIAKEIKECSQEALKNGHGKQWMPGVPASEKPPAG